MSLLGRRKAARDARHRELERPDYGWIWKPLLALLLIYLLVTLALGIWWSREPPPFDVELATAEQRQALDGDQSGLPGARGTVITATLKQVVDTLTDKPGGYLRNDIAPPGVWLDNMPNWELGVLRQSRDLSASLLEMAGGGNANLEEAERRLQVSSRDWLYPSAEQRFGQASEALAGYLSELGEEGAAGLAPQGEPLADWLGRVETRLEDLTRRLSASIGERDASRALGIDADERPEATPWYRVDDIFFETRGSAWALLHFLRGMERDYADLLEAAEAHSDWHQLIAELEMTQRRIWSPVILNGSGFGIFANHSLVMANYTVRARDLAGELASRVAAVEVTEVHAAEEEQAVEPPVEEVVEDDQAVSEDAPDEGSDQEADEAEEAGPEDAEGEAAS
ncbi:hypothetical protein SAMN05192555_11828 [Franzmannia pantelleriensis]|uniref:DUF2333 domain-containing protein n=1 Tax=Franzmannia pantelleriensis TaxID=48727 RepID=A0A1G9VJW1_9GAMM|nr:DUF2333 family protein [Halomonas pantelleriensis]SDM72484.1 hypothetical protein SAMN05192555_11828 [Halomonas pantelleriensis]